MYTHDRASRDCRYQLLALPFLQGNQTLYEVSIVSRDLQEKQRTIDAIVERHVNYGGIQFFRAPYYVGPIVSRGISSCKATCTRYQRQRMIHLLLEHTTIYPLYILVSIMLNFLPGTQRHTTTTGRSSPEETPAGLTTLIYKPNSNI